MERQSLLHGKYKDKKINLSSAEFAHRMTNVTAEILFRHIDTCTDLYSLDISLFIPTDYECVKILKIIN